MSLTPAQARAAFASGSVAVRAGAGTGKTFMLTQRYLHHLKGGLSPLEVVAVTFTERAAAELRARIRKAADGAELPEDYRFEVEAAPISTIHALAARICREHPDEAGVPPDYTILDDIEGGVWRAEHLDEALAALPARLHATLGYATLRDCLGELLKETEASAAALAVGAQGWPDLVKACREQACARLMGRADWRDARDTLERYQGDAGDKRETARQHVLAAVRAITAGNLSEGLEYLGNADLRGGKVSAWPGGGLEEVKEAVKTIRACLSEAVEEGITLELGPADEALAALLPELGAAFEATRRHLEDAKRAARLLDYNDLLYGARRALRRPEVRAHYASRWKAYLIDEVQDTSPIQADLLGALTERATVTIVGDEKQSIYGFLGADETVFAQMQARVTLAGGGAESLSDCFRIHRSLIGTLNAVTASLLGTVHQALVAQREAPQPGAPVQGFVVTSEGKASRQRRQVTEARHLAELIRKLIDDKAFIHDKTTGRHRPIELKDIAILTRSWKPLDTYSEILPALGVGAAHAGGGNLLATREAKDALAVLALLANPADDLALAAVLRGPHFALSDRALASTAQCLAKGTSWWERLQDAPPAPAAHAARTLAAWLAQKHAETPSRLLQKLDTQTGYTAVIANLPGGARRLADYRAFLDVVRQFEPGSDAFTVSRRLERLARAEVSLPRPTLHADDAVSLMTIHHAKGLEWPVVILADLDYNPGARPPTVYADPALGVAMKVDEDSHASEPALYTILKRARAVREAEEVKRLLYVGLTRARDALVVSAPREKGGALELLLPCLEAAGLWLATVPHTPETASYPQHASGQARANGDVGELWRLSPSDLGAHAAFVGAKTAAAPPLEAPGPWATLRELFTLYEETRWLPLLDALERAGVPAPDPEACMAPLSPEDDTLALLRWDEVALVEVGTPSNDNAINAIALLHIEEDDLQAAVVNLAAFFEMGR